MSQDDQRCAHSHDVVVSVERECDFRIGLTMSWFHFKYWIPFTAFLSTLFDNINYNL